MFKLTIEQKLANNREMQQSISQKIQNLKSNLENLKKQEEKLLKFQENQNFSEEKEKSENPS